jgi:hypothetical protein
MSEATKAIGEQLRDPFPLAALGWKPQAVKGNRALAVAYIDARDVMQRLDDVVGVENWQDEYLPLDGGQVMCKLSVRFGDGWVTKCDVGGESEQPDKGDREKAAFSDALKRAAVKFGIGRYLYSMSSQWCDYDPVKKQFVQTPLVPAHFLPTPAKGRPAAGAPPKPAASPHDQHAAAIRAAKNLDALKAVMDQVNADAKAKRLTADQIADLGALKDAQKTQLAKLAELKAMAADGPELDADGNPIFAAEAGALFGNPKKQTGVPH